MHLAAQKTTLKGMYICICNYVCKNVTSDRIMEGKFTALLGNYDRVTYRPTDQPTYERTGGVIEKLHRS